MMPSFTATEPTSAERVKKIADDVVYLINDGFESAKNAIDKIEQAQEMQINDDYREYLRLKEESLKRELEAFENYRQAARTLLSRVNGSRIAISGSVNVSIKRLMSHSLSAPPFSASPVGELIRLFSSNHGLKWAASFVAHKIASANCGVSESSDEGELPNEYVAR